ncbi:hypothetical protein E5676_scaffold356G00060 [Cucumis melo var. makuwa]|uniref:Uncharacterized protein n=1 Tax=Cucumis melo var. makuwa TaxID=1194695 RepID=A0A5D3CJJ7_CUCMM|nr:hypothetical protein E6C27_scaffold3921G00070 [Cucumis melo var. makuwa]TYK11991.1 hypothetical protein E5676_scaffold356G00060 [Cucumis melo var. makuwa]
MQSFGEDICRLIGGRDRFEMKSVALKVMANKVTIILNVLYSFMEYIIVCNLNSTAIITMKNSG